MNIEAIIFYILLIDAISANLMVQISGVSGTCDTSARISRWFPPAEGWALYYLALVLWVGSLLYRAGMLF